MEIVSFLIIGLLAGWIASLLVKGEGSGIFSDIFIGIFGALVGGFIFRFFDVSAYGFYESLGMSILGAVFFLLTLRVLYKRHYRKSAKI